MPKLFYLLLFLVVFLSPTQLLSDASASSSRLTPVVRAVQKTLPAVVNVSTERMVRVSDPFERFFNNFFSPHYRYFRESIPLGSGVIVDGAGLVVTNYHVVQRASKVEVKLLNGKSYGAEIVAYDVTNDLCLLCLRCDADEPPMAAIDFALPGDLFLGETVVTVGNPFGLEHSVAQGVLSARNRSFREGDVTFHDILQTDAAINPGNSGGPLVNLDGQLIGINLAIRPDAEGIGFAIPMGRIESVLARWLLPCRFSLGHVGLVPKTVMQGAVPAAIVDEVIPHSPADKAGIAAGDCLVSINGTPTSRAADVGRLLWQLGENDTVAMEVAGKGVLKLTAQPMSASALARQRLGLSLQELTPPLRQALGFPDDARGLAISDIRTDNDLGSHTSRWGDMVRRGDILVQVNGRETGTMQELFEALKDTRSGMKIPVILVAVDTIRNKVSFSPVRIDMTLN